MPATTFTAVGGVRDAPPAAGIRLTLAIARDLRAVLPMRQRSWRALLDAEIVAATERHRKILRDRKSLLNTRALAERMLADLPDEDPEIVAGRRAILLGEEPPVLCPCGQKARGSYCEAHLTRVRRDGDPRFDIPVREMYGGRHVPRRGKAA